MRFLYLYPFMYGNISITEWIGRASQLPLVDVRTPAEFAQGHIPGAHNVPLFSNEERVQVGTTYKQQSREQAILLGFDYVGPKWSDMIRQCLEIAPQKKIAVHCWRGGMRSGALAWALALYGFEVYQVKGGYKQYRRWAHTTFQRNYTVRMLGGMTGSGKTELLLALQQAGQQVIDLEGLAQHQGSSYGSMNQLVQPTQEQFENDLAWQLKDMDAGQALWLEDECRKIGKREIPAGIWTQMRSATLVDLQLPAEYRVQRLLGEYGVLDKEFLIAGTERISKRLGPEQTKHALAAIHENRMADFIRIALVYYDKTYRRGLSKRDPATIFPLPLAHSGPDTQTLLDFAGKLPQQLPTEQ